MNTEQALVDEVVLHRHPVGLDQDARVHAIVRGARVSEMEPAHGDTFGEDAEHRAFAAGIDGHLAPAFDGDGFPDDHGAGIGAGLRPERASRGCQLHIELERGQSMGSSAEEKQQEQKRAHRPKGAQCALSWH